MGHQCLRCRQQGTDFKHRSFKWREIISWSLLDFSNSMVIMINMGVYPAYARVAVFKNYASLVNAQMIINVVSSVLVFLISPPLGALTDIMYFRVALTTISSIVYSVATMCYYPIVYGSEQLFMAMQFFSTAFFRISESVNGAYLPSLCTDRDVGFVSSFGYFIGFVAGVIVLLLFQLLTSVDTTNMDQSTALKATNKAYSTAMLVVGIIMLLSTLPPILMMDNGIPKGEKRPKWKWSYIGGSFKQNGRTFKTAFKSENKYVALVLLDYCIMSIPIQALGSFSGALTTEYGGPYGITPKMWQTALIVYNVGVAVFSLIYGLLSKVVSAKILISIAYVILTCACLFGCLWQLIPYDLENPHGANPAYAWMWVIIVSMACCLGPIQALQRGLIGLLAKPEQKNEIFGLLECMVIFGSIIGSTVPGFLSKMGPWQFYTFEVAFFVAGFIMFLFIPVMKAEKMAHERAEKMKDEQVIEGAEVAAELKEGDAKSKDESSSSKDSSSDSSSSSSSSSSSGSSSSPALSESHSDKKSSSISSETVESGDKSSSQ